MSSEWAIFVALGAAAIAAISLISNLLDKNLSIREHDEYKRQMHLRFVEMNELRDKLVDIIAERVAELEKTRPTAGQLQDSTAALKERIENLERTGTGTGTGTGIGTGI